MWAGTAEELKGPSERYPKNGGPHGLWCDGWRYAWDLQVHSPAEDEGPGQPGEAEEEELPEEEHPLDPARGERSLLVAAEHPLESPGHPLESPGHPLEAPGHPLESPEHPLEAPG